MPKNANIARYVSEVAAAHPDKRAVVFPARRDLGGEVRDDCLSFRELDDASDRYAWGLTRLGVAQGTRVLLMVRPSLDFFALTFALFKTGAVPIFIDPGMGWRSFMRCAGQAVPEAFIGIPAAHVMRWLFPSAFRTVHILVTLGPRLGWGGRSLRELEGAACGPFPTAVVAPDDMAAVLFTTGSTGPAKGVVYTHRVFITQTEILRREYGITPADVDLPCFPLFALFSTALGATAVIPDMDPTRPARVNPDRIVEAVNRHGVTYSFGSPALWNRVATHCAERGVRLASLRRVLIAGAPVPGHVHQRLLKNVLPEGAETYTPYGATEALPVCNFTGSEALAETWPQTRRGAGMCVGRPLPEVEARIIRITDEPIAIWADAKPLATGEIGEIVVRGPVVTQAYDHLPEADRLAKIQDGTTLWHRMGDVGYVDALGRLWFCGRKQHRVETVQGPLYTVRCEAIFNEHPNVCRSALVGVGADRQRQTPVIVVEPRRRPSGHRARQTFARELLALGAQSELTRNIRHVLFHRAFPVDIRHNAKIRREVLATWADRQIQPELTR